MNEEKQLVLPYIFLPPDQGNTSFLLCVSCPDGLLIEFPVDGDMMPQVEEALHQSGLWSAFFMSLIQSIQRTKENDANEPTG